MTRNADRRLARSSDDLALWPRIQKAIAATTVSRADVMVNLPACHRRNCLQSHGDIDLVFRMFADRIADTIYTELACAAVTEPEGPTEYGSGGPSRWR